MEVDWKERFINLKRKVTNYYRALDRFGAEDNPTEELYLEFAKHDTRLRNVSGYRVPPDVIKKRRNK